VEVSPEAPGKGLSWVEYKTIRQYQTMGDILEMLRSFGHDGMVDDYSLIFTDQERTTSNGYFWLTRDPPLR
jgi:hypothetical protein